MDCVTVDVKWFILTATASFMYLENLTFLYKTAREDGEQ